MNYFIDFEATQFSNEIISIGCVREDGKQFYSLVAPSNFNKVTPFITRLTGITKEMLSEALSADQIFSSFYDWVFEEDNEPVFYCWGSSDTDFVKGTFKRCCNLKSKMILGYLCADMNDYGKIICHKAKIQYPISLIKMYTIFESDAIQNHNALEDAQMLLSVWQQSQKYTISELRNYLSTFFTKKEPSKEKIENKQKEVFNTEDCNLAKGTIYILDKNNNVLLSWNSLQEAIMWVFDKKIPLNQKPKTSLDTIEKNIKKAYNRNKLYFNLRWKKVN